MKRWLLLSLIAITGLVVMFLVDNHYRQHIRQGNANELADKVNEFQNTLSTAVRLRLVAVEDLRAFMLASPMLPDNRTFDRFAAELLVNNAAIRTVQYVDTDRIIRFVYPLAGNEAALNLDLKTRPAAPFVEKAIQEQITTVNNPTVTVQGSLAIVARTPLYREDEFLGLVQGVFDIAEIMKGTGAELRPPYKFQLTDATGAYFWGAETMAGESQTTTIIVGDNSWTMIVGWDAPPHQPDPWILFLIWGGGTLLLLSLLYIVNQNWLKTERLTSTVSRTITERERVEETLRESETRFQLAVQAANVGLWDWKIGTSEVYYSPEWKHQIGYADNEITNDYQEWETRLHPDDLERMQTTIQSYLKNPWPNYEEEFRFQHKDGTYRWILTTASIFHDEHGQPIRMLGSHIDITRKKEIEQALQDNELLLRETSKLAKIGGWELNATTLEGARTEAVTLILDLDPDQPADLAAGLDFFWGESRRLIRDAIKDAIKWDKPFDLELELTTKKGNHKWVRAIGTPIVGAHKVIKVRGVLQDITDQKLAEQALRRYADRLEILYQIDQAILAAHSAEETAQAALAHLQQLIPYQQATISLIDPEDLTATVLAEQKSDNHSPGMSSYISPDRILNDLDALKHGQILVTAANSPPQDAYSTLTAPLLCQEDLIGVLMLWSSRPDSFNDEHRQIVREVANQIAIAVQNAQLADRFRRVVTSISDFIYMIEVNEARHPKNRYVSPNIESLTGYPVQRFLNDWAFWAETVIHPEDRAGAAEQWARLTAGRDSEVEYRLVRADGQVIWIRDSARVEQTGDRSQFIFGVFSDITRRKHLEEQLYQAQKMEAIGRLAGGIAHDFNNLLTVITGFGEFVLQTGLEPDHPAHRDIEQIVKAGQRAAALTQQLLAFSRKQVLQPQILHLNETVGQMSKMLRRLLGENIDLIIQLAPELGMVKIDPGQMDQVLINLVVNARDAMPQGGRLTIETANIELDDAYARAQVEVIPGRYIMLAISDSGQGLDAAAQAHLFEPFFTTKERGKGTGLGLATVHGIINQSGGHIWVYSEPGQGTTFKIYLPRIDEAPQMPHRVSDPVETQPGSETILLVEDEMMVRDFAQRVLSDEGYTVLAARSGPEALQIVDQYHQTISLLITDVILPDGMSGPETAEILIAQRPALKVLYISGYTDNAIVHHGVLGPGVFFLEKPFTATGLLHKIREVIDRREG
ncbi:MAG: PAS domain-containing protein [Anaerolineales bacterium]|nr:PAS domain-containing protein [Anaerolineales bacterium]